MSAAWMKRNGYGAAVLAAFALMTAIVTLEAHRSLGSTAASLRDYAGVWRRVTTMLVGAMSMLALGFSIVESFKPQTALPPQARRRRGSGVLYIPAAAILIAVGIAIAVAISVAGLADGRTRFGANSPVTIVETLITAVVGVSVGAGLAGLGLLLMTLFSVFRSGRGT